MDVVPQSLVNETMSSEIVVKDIDAVDNGENDNYLFEENLSSLPFGTVIRSLHKENAKQVQDKEDMSDTGIVTCDERQPASETESQDENGRVMKILADYRREMGYTGDDIPYTSLNTQNARESTEQDRSGLVYNYINVSASDDPLNHTEPASDETLNHTEPASDGPLNLTCQDEVFNIKPVMVNSSAQFGDESLNLTCQDESPEKKPLFERLNECLVVERGDEDIEAARMYADLVHACSFIATDKFTFVKNADIVRFIQLYDKEVTKIKLAVSVEPDFIINITVNDKLLPADHGIWEHIPKVSLNGKHIENLLKTLATYRVCSGNPDKDLQNVMHFLDRSEEDAEQNYKGYRDEYIGSTIRSQLCPILISGKYERCKNCQTYRRCLKKQLQRKNVKSQPSETDWLKSKIKNHVLSEPEKLEKLKQMREHIVQLEKAITGLNRENRVLVKKIESQPNNKKHKSTMTENTLNLRTDLGPEFVGTNNTNSSSVSQQSVSHPVSISKPLPISEESCNVTLKDEATNKINDIIGVFKTPSGIVKPIIIKIVNDQKKTPDLTSKSENIAYMYNTSKKKNGLTVDKDTCEKDAVLRAVDKLDNLESSLELNHVESKSEEPQNNQGQVCKICNKVVKSMRTHMIIHRPVKRFKCSICEKSFHRKSSLELHASVHSGEKAHKCPICDQAFSYHNSMKRHIFIHTGVRPFKCSYCPKSFVNKFKRREHEQAVHTGVKSFACKICSMMFKTTNALHFHKSMHHGEPDASAEQHLCDQCGRSYKSKFALKNHKNSHKNEYKKEKSLACDECDMKFAWAYQLNHHKQKKHYGIDESQKLKNYICHICGKGFYDKPQLRQHQAVHSDKRPFKCSQCSASFKRSSKLRTHENTHSGIKPHKCKWCFKSFALKYDMETHELNMHQGKRDFVCTICSKTFVRVNLLRSHMKIHGGNQFHECHQCNKRFIRLSALEKHKLTHSNEDATTELL